MDMARPITQLKHRILNENNVFDMKFEEFQQLFPSKLRNDDEAKLLYGVIRERKKEAKKRVKENIKEYVEKNEEIKLPDVDEVLESMAQLKDNLTKDMDFFDDNFQCSHQLITQYFAYLRSEVEEIMEESEAAPPNMEEKEFQCFIEDL